MKSVTVRELRTQFPKIEAMLLNGEELVITKRGQIVAWLIQPPMRVQTRRLDFKKRFGGRGRRPGPVTDIVGVLLAEREESL